MEIINLLSGYRIVVKGSLVRVEDWVLHQAHEEQIEDLVYRRKFIRLIQTKANQRLSLGLSWNVAFYKPVKPWERAEYYIWD